VQHKAEVLEMCNLPVGQIWAGYTEITENIAQNFERMLFRDYTELFLLIPDHISAGVFNIICQPNSGYCHIEVRLDHGCGNNLFLLCI
jgi:hypothetical protein